MLVALYKGPAPGLQKISHGLICWKTKRPHSHCEIVLSDGLCYSSSSRDSGVRRKEIDIESGKWDLIDIEGDEDYVKYFFELTKGNGYDYAGVARYVFPSLPNITHLWYCSEWCASALRLKEVDISPGDFGLRVLASPALQPRLIA